MNAQELIRAQPFRYAAHMAPKDQAWVAARMQKAVTEEQRNLGNTPGKTPMEKTGVSDEARARLAATMQKVMAVMADGQPRSCPSIMQLSGAKDHEVRAALVELRASGKMAVVRGKRVGQIAVYQLRVQA